MKKNIQELTGDAIVGVCGGGSDKAVVVGQNLRCPDVYKGFNWTETTQANAYENYEIDCFYGWSASFTAGHGKHVAGGNWKDFGMGMWDCLGHGNTSEVCIWAPL